MEFYDVLNQLAQGGQGTTLRVKRKLDNQIVVLKQSFCDNAKSGNDALREAKTLQGLDHPHIVRYEDVFLTEDGRQLVVCLVMAYMEGGDLARYMITLKKHGMTVEPNRVVVWTKQLSSAIAYLHQHKIVHRDLKPQNVFMADDNVLKVGDFGLAQTIERGKRTSHVGTPCYMAPEVLHHDEYADAVDVWGMGCILMETMTLEFLWERKGMLASQVEHAPVRAADFPQTYPHILRDCIARCLRKAPEQRPGAAMLLDALENAGRKPENSSLDINQLFGDWQATASKAISGLWLGNEKEEEKPEHAILSMAASGRFLLPDTQEAGRNPVPVKPRPIPESPTGVPGTPQRAAKGANGLLVSPTGTPEKGLMTPSPKPMPMTASMLLGTPPAAGSRRSSTKPSPAQSPTSRTSQSPGQSPFTKPLRGDRLTWGEKDEGGGVVEGSPAGLKMQPLPPSLAANAIPPAVFEQYRQSGLFAVDPKYRGALSAMMQAQNSRAMSMQLEADMDTADADGAQFLQSLSGKKGQTPGFMRSLAASMAGSDNAKNKMQRSFTWGDGVGKDTAEGLPDSQSSQSFKVRSKREKRAELQPGQIVEMSPSQRVAWQSDAVDGKSGDKKVIVRKGQKEYELKYGLAKWEQAQQSSSDKSEAGVQDEYHRLFGPPPSRYIGSVERLTAV